MKFEDTIVFKVLQKVWRFMKLCRLEMYWLTVPSKWRRIRSKERIKVLFVLHETAMWRTEELYLAMLRHHRFEPVLAVTEARVEHSKEKLRLLKEYLDSKHYTYTEVRGYDIQRKVKPDMIFYSQPYDPIYPKSIFWMCNTRSLFGYVNYGFTTCDLPFFYTRNYHKYSAQYYVDNEMVRQCVLKHIDRDRGSIRVTGLPASDAIMRPSPKECDPWKAGNEGKKRIIYAPHWSIRIDDRAMALEYATFLEFGEFIQRLAEKYADTTQWAFKPHPSLKARLEEAWGVERTQAYYDKWDAMSNAQCEYGAYMDLFKHSDAMMHDCSSFTVEYLYMKKPVMFLVNGKCHDDTINDFCRLAYEQHYKGMTEADIERFVVSVVNGDDPKRSQRAEFYDRYLLPPNGRTASENIIEAILEG